MKMENETISGIASKTSYIGAGGAVFFGMTANEFAAIGGLCIGVIGLVINFAFKWIAHIEQKEHHRRIESKSE